MEKTASQIQKERTKELEDKANVCYFLGGDSVTLIGNVEFIEDKDIQEAVWNETDRRFFKKELKILNLGCLSFTPLRRLFGLRVNLEPVNINSLQSCFR